MAKSKWEEVKEKLVLVEAWARDGLVEADIAKKLGIAMSTLSLYKNEHSEFLAALKRGKEVADVDIENALYKRAMGYKYDEVTSERHLNQRTGEYELIEVKRVVKEVQPDVTAQIFWLKNRRPEQWRDKRVEEITVKEMPEIIIKRSE